ncbi:MAG TPA: SMI1/KNR4 family protein [Sphingomicrobium sp.]
MTDELLARIAKRAADPKRRYMTAAEDEARVELPIDEISRRFDDWDARNAEQAREAALRDGMTPEEYERNLQENKEIQERYGRSRSQIEDMMAAQRAEWGLPPLTKMSFVETDGHISASSRPPGATPLSAPPSGQQWAELERAVGRKMPDDLKRLYSIADGGFGPGFRGLSPVDDMGRHCEDLRRRGPDYCGTVAYPDSFLPLAEEVLDYHYDLDTGRIISSDRNWYNHDLEAEDIYDIAFQSLAAMMEDWLQKS